MTIMRMEAGLDTGPMLLWQAVRLKPRPPRMSWQERLAAMGAVLAVRALAEAPAAMAQPADGVTYAAKLRRQDGVIDWAAPAAEIERRIRAMDPWPGTETRLFGRVLKVHAAELAAGHGAPGEVLDEAMTVACGVGALRLARVAGGRPGGDGCGGVSARAGGWRQAPCWADGRMRWALLIEYHGGGFHGWQRQASGFTTVQLVLETAAAVLAGAPVTCHRGGTDGRRSARAGPGGAAGAARTGTTRGRCGTR